MPQGGRRCYRSQAGTKPTQIEEQLAKGAHDTPESSTSRNALTLAEELRWIKAFGIAHVAAAVSLRPPRQRISTITWSTGHSGTVVSGVMYHLFSSQGKGVCIYSSLQRLGSTNLFSHRTLAHTSCQVPFGKLEGKAYSHALCGHRL